MIVHFAKEGPITKDNEKPQATSMQKIFSRGSASPIKLVWLGQSSSRLYASELPSWVFRTLLSWVAHGWFCNFCCKRVPFETQGWRPSAQKRATPKRPPPTTCCPQRARVETNSHNLLHRLNQRPIIVPNDIIQSRHVPTGHLPAA